jgi:hypothetical protein
MPDPPPSASVATRRVEASIAADGGAQIDWRVTVTGVSAPSWRVRYHAEGLRKERLQEDLSGDFPGIDLKSVDTNDLENVEAPVQIHATGKVTSFGRRDGDTVSTPIGPHPSMVHDFALLSSRKLDLRLPAQTTRATEYVVKLPAGAKVVAMPGATEKSSPFGTFALTVEPLAGGARIKTTLALTKTRIPVAEYPAFRAWCESVDAALGQRLVGTVGGH